MSGCLADRRRSRGPRGVAREGLPSTGDRASIDTTAKGRRRSAMWGTPALLLSMLGCTPPIDPATPPFRPIDYDAALEAAAREGKVVFLDFYASWCPPCRRLDSTTWKDPAVVAWLDANTIPVKIDAEAEGELAWAFMVEAYPTLVLVDAEGTELGRMLGFLPPEVFLDAAKSVIDRAATTSGDHPIARDALPTT
ncbi:MAG: thioredoxin family protein [Phycisphaerales bacterium]|nr:thioredoxin family protein [Planctomycetota bacterium]